MTELWLVSRPVPASSASGDARRIRAVRPDRARPGRSRAASRCRTVGRYGPGSPLHIQRLTSAADRRPVKPRNSSHRSPTRIAWHGGGAASPPHRSQVMPERGNAGSAQPRGELAGEQLDRDRDRVAARAPEQSSAPRRSCSSVTRSMRSRPARGSSCTSAAMSAACASQAESNSALRPGGPAPPPGAAYVAWMSPSRAATPVATSLRARRARSGPAWPARACPSRPGCAPRAGRERAAWWRARSPRCRRDLSADNHATNLAITLSAGQLRPGTLLVSLFTIRR